MDAVRNLRRARNDFMFAAVMFAATSGSALWIGHSMDEGERFDMHSRLPKTTEMQEFATHAENILLIPCAVFPILSAWVFQRRRKTYEEAKQAVPALKP